MRFDQEDGQILLAGVLTLVADAFRSECRENFRRRSASIEMYTSRLVINS
jgi:hypothetical protein